MAKKKKGQGGAAPAPNKGEGNAKSDAPMPIQDAKATDAAAANRLGLYIAVIGIVAVLVIGGGLVWLNMLGQPQGGDPPLASTYAAGPVNLCRGSPEFPIEKLGFSRNVVFSTSERLNKGLQLIEPGADGSLTNGRTYQHPSWTMGGYLGVFVVDREGNVYVAPSPRISLLDNPPERANIVYKVDAKTGEMGEFVNLPFAETPSAENPYGILALSYDCDTNSLYVTSVMGSTRDEQVGRIYQIDLATGEVVDQYDGFDAFGVSAFNLATGKRLYFGSARTPEVYSIALNDKGNFSGEPKLEATLGGAFNKPRRIEFNARDEMLVRGIDFNFTLSATSEDRRTDYTFTYDAAEGKWVQIAP